MSKKVLVTGGAGFIGHQVIKELLTSTDWEILVVDRLSYAGNLNRINEVLIEGDRNSKSRVNFIYHDLKASVNETLMKQIKDIHYIVHIGASSHVTRSVKNPSEFVQDNVVGTFNPIRGCKTLRQSRAILLF